MQNYPDKKLKLRLYGTFSAEWSDGSKLPISSAKLRAMVALLATAPDMKRTRSWLQDKLWSLSGQELGRASLRRGLSDLKRAVGDDFNLLFDISHDDVAPTPSPRPLAVRARSQSHLFRIADTSMTKTLRPWVPATSS